MIIQKMNNVLVKHGKVTFAVFTIVIIISFVWYFSPGVDGSLLFGNRIGAGSKYGSVLGRDILISDVANARQSISIFSAALYGLPPYRVQSPDEKLSFQFAAIEKTADILSIQAGDKEVADVIRTLPAFQKDGKFSEELYAEYRNKYLKPAGLDYSDLEESVRTMIRMKKVPNLNLLLQSYLMSYIPSLEFLSFYTAFFDGIPEMMSADVILPEGEAEAGVESMLQKITFHLITFDPESFKDQVKIEDADVKEFYTANPSLFMSEPESDGLLAFAAYTEKKTEVTEEQMKDYYELRKATFLKDDGTEKTFDEVKDDIRKELEVTVDRDEAIAKADAFNKSFRDAVNADKEAYQADPQKLFREEAEKAGMKVSEIRNLTARTKESAELHIDHDLVEAVTILKSVGSFTNRLKGEDGVSMFLLTARRPSVVQPFEDVKDVAQKYVLNQKERVLADDAAAQLGLKFVELKDASAEIEGLVKSLKGTWHAEIMQPRFKIEEKPYLDDESGNFIPLPVNKILSTDVGKLSAPVKYEEYGNYPIFVFVNAHTPATAEEIAEQKDELILKLNSLKQRVVSLGLGEWIDNTAKIYTRGQNQE